MDLGAKTISLRGLPQYVHLVVLHCRFWPFFLVILLWHFALLPFLDFCHEFSYCTAAAANACCYASSHPFCYFREVRLELIHFYITSGSGIQHTLTSRTYSFRNESKLQWHISLRANIMYAWSTHHARTNQWGRRLILDSKTTNAGRRLYILIHGYIWRDSIAWRLKAKISQL